VRLTPFVLHRGIAGAIDAGGTLQGLYFQASVVGKAVNMVVVVDIACLLQSILLQGLSCLRNIDIAMDVA